MLPLRCARRADAPERRRDAAVVGRRRRRVAQVALGLLEPAQRLERAVPFMLQRVARLDVPPAGTIHLAPRGRS